jgi:hypothetical protein
MTEDHVDIMRTYIVLAEAATTGLDEETAKIVEETPVVETETPIIMHDLGELVFKLRGFMETSSGEYALGVETGMQQAADMIENLIRRYNKGDNLG